MGSPALDLVTFPERADRVRYMAATFAPYLAGRVLDVGCDVRVLKGLRPDLDYVGIDIGGDPDIKIDLEEVEKLPFADQAFDTVVCSEVLEHLDHLHRVFAELVRVSRRHVLISLPNCWTAARRPVTRGKGSIGHYGLPADRPPDRHKWFFSLSEAEEFARAQARQHGLSIVESRVSEKPRPALVRALRRLQHPSRAHYLNLFAHTLWIVFAKPGATTGVAPGATPGAAPRAS
jgi:SAM-dependent methyltransferase